MCSVVVVRLFVPNRHMRAVDRLCRRRLPFTSPGDSLWGRTTSRRVVMLATGAEVIVVVPTH